MYNYNIYYACFLWNNIVDRIRQKHTLEEKQKMTDCCFNILNWIFYNDSKCISIYDVLFVIFIFVFYISIALFVFSTSTGFILSNYLQLIYLIFILNTKHYF